MKARVLTLAAVLAAGSAAAVDAQTPVLPSVPQSLSLEDAIGLAERYNPVYRQTLNDRGPAAWNVRNAYASFLPNFSVSNTYGYTGSGSQRFLATEFQTSSTIGSAYGLNLNLTLNGNTLMQPGVQKAALSATDARIDAAQMTTRNSVIRQYLAVLEAEAQVDLQTQQVVRNQENLRLAEARFQVGQTTMLDVRQAEVAKGQSDVGLLQAEQSVIVEKLRLFQLVGVPAPADPTVVVLSDTFSVIEPNWTLEQLLEDAADYNPDVKALKAQETSQRWNERSVKSQWLPSISLSASWAGFTQQFTDSDLIVAQAEASAANNLKGCNTQNQVFVSAGLPPEDCSQFAFTPEREAAVRAQNSVFPFDFTQQPFTARATLSFPIFDQFSRNLQNSRASAAVEDAREAVRARELQVRTDVSQQHYGLIASYQAIQIQENNRVSAQEQLRLQRERYRVGSGTFFELLDAQLINQQAEADYITALFNYHRALADLEAAVGRQLR